jgi:hypothetical protein
MCCYDIFEILDSHNSFLGTLDKLCPLHAPYILLFMKKTKPNKIIHIDKKKKKQTHQNPYRIGQLFLKTKI